MSEFIEIMIKPFAACLILTGIHSYLGMHILTRGVIFVDLALAQTAAFGATVGFALGCALHSSSNYLFSLGFTLIGAVILALTRKNRSAVPQEAYIGIVYVIFASASILVLSRAPEGGEELKSLMVGHLLFIDWSEVLAMFLLYSGVGIFHWFLRKEFFALSAAHSNHTPITPRSRLLDFLFYASFGVVVTCSTDIAGVLLVFTFLVVPAVCAFLLARSLTNRLLIAWGCGFLTSSVGISLSYFFDLPTGASVVCTFGVTLLACLAIHYCKCANSDVGDTGI